MTAARLLAAAALAGPLALAAQASALDLKRPEVAAFVEEVVSRDNLSRHEVRTLLAAAQSQPQIIDIMNRPIEKVAPWWEYREHFVTAERIAQGVEFWGEHRAALAKLAADYQVPPEYVVAILGVETKYGRITGHYRVLDALATLAFDYPARRSYFRGELEQFLLLVKENRLDPLTLTGSYAGAMGAPQFMPSAYRRYAVDANTDRQRDLWGDWDDILASIANYLKENGWQPGGPVLTEASLDPDPAFQIEPRNVKLNDTVGGLAARGVKLALPLPGDTPAVLLSAEQKDGPAYRVGFHNFYVITRYNASARYAMAVHDLARAIAAQVGGAPP
ncbi:MAG: lytic murein transglycosylase B [Gammaproteobacteria bacterium]|nr:lytic murein transglycosylase B [Gammaproteobacteria bacterium]MBV9695952.1 lytic murein transglycosylase B [Gammaproteobacteria bacterium]